MLAGPLSDIKLYITYSRSPFQKRTLMLTGSNQNLAFLLVGLWFGAERDTRAFPPCMHFCLKCIEGYVYRHEIQGETRFTIFHNNNSLVSIIKKGRETWSLKVKEKYQYSIYMHQKENMSFSSLHWWRLNTHTHMYMRGFASHAELVWRWNPVWREPRNVVAS